MNKTKLELTWIGKDKRPKLEPRILLEDPELSYHASHKVSENDIFDNKLIFGDNLLALKALEQEYTGKVKCIYIDPPYNTGNAFEHYDDAVEHSLWLSLMRDRLIILRNLLRSDGFICCHIDDSEGHYLKVLMDEVFGRSNYVSTIYVQVRYADKTLKQDMSFHKQIEQVHVYRKDWGAKPNLNTKQKSFDKFNFYIKEKGKGREITLGGKRVVIFNKGDYEITKGEGSEDGLKEIWATGSILDGNSSGRFFRDYFTGRVEEDGLGVLYKVYGIGDDKFDYRYFTGPQRAGATKGKYFQGVPVKQLEDEDLIQTTPIENFYDLAGSFGNCRHEGGVDFRSGKKPEKLIEIILKHFSNCGDLVLDSFGGSGSTGAVAHKMGRRWIMVELGDHCHTHIIPRLQKVIDGEDQGGISKTVNWQGGGGFRYYKLAPSLIEYDRFGQPVINKKFNAEMLAEAVCKLEGFTYAPSDTLWWQHGYSTETDFIYVTTQNLSIEQLEQISEEVGSDKTLLVMCGAFRCKSDRFANLTIKKMPKAVLKHCEWAHDDYSLNVQNLPMAQEENEQQGPQQDDLF
ncbi:site-specific DNA-methyltransferase [Leclercia adecarboxylata]|uniref:site-specific DNA-methyltransferase n=1 Tax=Leclercia adecarboxylata TaxID=83655 RepID=UPI001E2BD5CB|nr:site-specific DNA-methyltransferase [Leclercia adecarboxylata]UFM68985.1 site-specific DNA-methyltransferase [Leclercia adecarboxylata]